MPMESIRVGMVAERCVHVPSLQTTEGFTTGRSVKMEAVNTFGVAKRSWADRLFRRAYVVLRDREHEGFAPGAITVNTITVLDWRDRLRVLVSGVCEVETRVYTSVAVERSEAESAFGTAPPAVRRRLLAQRRSLSK